VEADDPHPNNQRPKARLDFQHFRQTGATTLKRDNLNEEATWR
jgi:hypothetical protein